MKRARIFFLFVFLGLAPVFAQAVDSSSPAAGPSQGTSQADINNEAAGAIAMRGP